MYHNTPIHCPIYSILLFTLMELQLLAMKTKFKEKKKRNNKLSFKTDKSKDQISLICRV